MPKTCSICAASVTARPGPPEPLWGITENLAMLVSATEAEIASTMGSNFVLSSIERASGPAARQLSDSARSASARATPSSVIAAVAARAALCAVADHARAGWMTSASSCERTGSRRAFWTSISARV